MTSLLLDKPNYYAEGAFVSAGGTDDHWSYQEAMASPNKSKRSKKQTSVALSNVEAEHITLSCATQLVFELNLKHSDICYHLIQEKVLMVQLN